MGDTLGELGPMLVRIGAGAALAVFAVVLILILTRSDGTYEVTAVFDDVRGAIEGGDVTAGAIEVGTIEEVDFGEDGSPYIRMRIDDDFRLHQGAFADIRLASNVGAVNRSVDLEQGDLSAPELEDGATLGPSQTDQPVDLDLAVSTLDPETRADAARLLVGLDLAFRGRGDDFARTLRHSGEALNETANLLSQVNSDGAAIKSLVDNASVVVAAMAESSTDLGESAERTATLLRITAGRQAELRRSLELLGPGLRGARVTLERLLEAIPNLRELVAGSGPLVGELRSVAEVLPSAIAALRPALGEAKDLVQEVPGALIASQPALEATLPLIDVFEPTVGYLNPFLDHLRVRTPEVMGTLQLFADGSSNYDANGNVLRAGLINIQSSRHPNIIDQATNTAGGIVSPFARIPGAIEGEPWYDYADSFIGGGPSLTSPSATGGAQ
jgi:phospholipid/cholesterol/gamma-HCH transport system substrate-binding protein